MTTATKNALDLDDILGTSAVNSETVQTTGGSYLTTVEKNAFYAALTPITIQAIGERTSYRWQKPEWVLKVTVGDDDTARLLTFEKGSAFRDAQISKMQLFLKSPASKTTDLVVALVRDETKRSKSWQFGKAAE